MRKFRVLKLALITLLALAPSLAQAGKIGSTLGRYTLAGAGIGCLLGAATGTIPWLSSKQTWDFITGAGAGAMVGAGVGFLGGVVDLSTETAGDEEAQEASLPQEGLFAWTAPGGGGVVFVGRF